MPWLKFVCHACYPIHNPDAGYGRGAIKADQLISLVRKDAHEAIYQSTKNKDFPSAGGDGAVTKVAQRLDGDRPMAVLPLATANNVAHSLGLRGNAK